MNEFIDVYKSHFWIKLNHTHQICEKCQTILSFDDGFSYKKPIDKFIISSWHVYNIQELKM